MSEQLPRDRWVGASPGMNVTPGGKALEAIDGIRAYIDQCNGTPPTTVLDDISEIIRSVNLGQKGRRP